jgi:hypothetical protein
MTVKDASGTVLGQGYVDLSSASYYNAGDGEIFFRAPGETVTTKSLESIQLMLGDTNHDGVIGTGETESSNAPYLLWSAGPDGVYGPLRAANTDPTPQGALKCDDVTNFR